MLQSSHARRILKWTGAGFSALILAAWVLSLWGHFRCQVTSRTIMVLSRGQFQIFNSEVDFSQIAPRPSFLQTGLDWRAFDPESVGFDPPAWMDLMPIQTPKITYQLTYIVIALWFLLLMSALPTAWLWLRDTAHLRVPPPSRARRILKWTGAGLSLFILALWIASCWWLAMWVLPGNRTYVAVGQSQVGLVTATFDVTKVMGSTGLHFDGDDGVVWIRDHSDWFKTSLGQSQRQGSWGYTAFLLPFWLLLLLTTIPTAWLWHRDRRRIRPGRCPRCGYDLTGNTSSVCSECGLSGINADEKEGPMTQPTWLKRHVH